MLGARALTQAIADACRDEGPASVVAEATQAAASVEIMRAGSTAATVVVAPESDDDDEQMVDSDEVEEEDEEEEIRTLMVPSLFTHRRGTVWFDYSKFIGERRSLDSQLLFPFQPSEMGSDCDFSLTFRQENNINCISQTLKRHGFRNAERGQVFNLHWGGYLSDSQLSKMVRCQHTNHYPGSFVLGRKDALWAAVSSQMRMFGEHYDFVAKTYILPRDRKLLKHDFEELGKHACFIIKPPNSACGIGIKLVTKYEDVPRKKRLVVQRYIGKPFLIKKKKFDLRLYVVVASFDPLRVYLYDDGLVRFATHDYSEPKPGHKKHVKDRFMHLTNYSINKSSDEFVQPSKAGDTNARGQAGGDGSKWTVRQLWSYMRENNKNVDVDKLIAEIKDVCVKTLIAAEPTLVSRCNHSRMPRGSGFEVYGFDVLFDHACKPWLLEVNVFPSLSSTSPLDKLIKTHVMTDVFHMVGIVPFDRKKVGDKRENQGLHRLPEDRDRKWQFTSKSVLDLETKTLEQILDTDDLEVVMEAEDELRRCGHLERIFPCPNVEYYSQFFPCKRYMNTLLWKWVVKPDWNLLLPFLRNPNSAPSLPNTPSIRALGASIKSPKVTKHMKPKQGKPFLAKKASTTEFSVPSAARPRHAELTHQTTKVQAGQAAQAAADALNGDKMHKLEKLERKLERLTRPVTPPVEKPQVHLQVHLPVPWSETKAAELRAAANSIAANSDHVAPMLPQDLLNTCPSMYKIEKGAAAKAKKSSALQHNKLSLQQRHEASQSGGKGAQRASSRSSSRQEAMASILRQNSRLASSVPTYFADQGPKPGSTGLHGASNALLSTRTTHRKNRLMTDLFSHNNDTSQQHLFHQDSVHRSQDPNLLIENLITETPDTTSSKPASKSAAASQQNFAKHKLLVSPDVQLLGETPGAVSSGAFTTAGALGIPSSPMEKQQLAETIYVDTSAPMVVLHQDTRQRRTSVGRPGAHPSPGTSPKQSPGSFKVSTVVPDIFFQKPNLNMHVDTRLHVGPQMHVDTRAGHEPTEASTKDAKLQKALSLSKATNSAAPSPVVRQTVHELKSPKGAVEDGGKREQLLLWRELLPVTEPGVAEQGAAGEGVKQRARSYSSTEASPASPKTKDDLPPYGVAAYMSLNGESCRAKSRADLDFEVAAIIGDESSSIERLSPASRPLLKPGKQPSKSSSGSRKGLRAPKPGSADGKGPHSQRNQISMFPESELKAVATVSMSWQPEVSKADRQVKGRTIAMGLVPDSKKLGRKDVRSSSSQDHNMRGSKSDADGRAASQAASSGKHRLQQQFHLDRSDIYGDLKTSANRTDGGEGTGDVVPWLSPKLFQTPAEAGAPQQALASQFKGCGGVETVVAPLPAGSAREDATTPKSSKGERTSMSVATATAHFASTNGTASGIARGGKAFRSGGTKNAVNSSAAWATLPDRQVLPPAGVRQRPTGHILHQPGGERDRQSSGAQSAQGMNASDRNRRTSHNTSQAFC